MNKIIKLLKGIWIVIYWLMLLPLYLIAYMFFCVIIICKVILKIHTKIISPLDKYLKS